MLEGAGGEGYPAMHTSIVVKGASLGSIALSASEFGCPLCPRFKTTREKTLRRHVDNHIENAVHFQDTHICRCNQSCRDMGHYHCPCCAKTIMRKEYMLLHVTGCQPPSVPPSDEDSPSSSSAPSLLTCCASQNIPVHPPPKRLSAVHLTPEDSPASVISVEHSYTFPPPVSAVGVDHSYTLSPTEAAQSPTVTQMFCQSPSSTPSEAPRSRSPSPGEAVSTTAQSETLELPSSRFRHLKSVECPYCSIVLYKKNLAVHIQRKHTRPKDVPAAPHLRSVCVDKSRGLYAVAKCSNGFSVPIHVQRKTWGKQPVTKCELEDDRQHRLLAQQSDLNHIMCAHIRSLDYCTNTAAEEVLKHEVLQEMLDCNFFSESTAAVCKKRQIEAVEADAPLAVSVELGGSENQICLSIHEPKIYRFSSLGRVVVNYNFKKRTWHCPCAKAHTSCPHKDIAKWHLFQTWKELFVTAPSATETLPDSYPPPSVEMDVYE